MISISAVATAPRSRATCIRCSQRAACPARTMSRCSSKPSTRCAKRSPRRSARIPRFDKGGDTRLPPSRWRHVTSPPKLILLEGWCIGVPPEAQRALTRAVNPLERREDPDALLAHVGQRAPRRRVRRVLAPARCADRAGRAALRSRLALARRARARTPQARRAARDVTRGAAPLPDALRAPEPARAAHATRAGRHRRHARRLAPCRKHPR